VRERARELLLQSEFRQYAAKWRDPWEFASAETTAERLNLAGFVDIHTWLEPNPVTLPDAGAYRSYLATIIFRTHLPVLPGELQERILDALSELGTREETPFELDYWRLNMDARRP
jgi:hypothetical protein